jgi:hypothetical protein
MAVVKELLVIGNDGNLNFGDYTLPTKAKLDGIVHNGDVYKVKTYKGLTKLEKNDLFLYESEPGTAVFDFHYEKEVIEFRFSAESDVQFTLGVEENTEYSVYLDDVHTGTITTNISGKLSVSAEVDGDKEVAVKIVKR